MKRVCAWCGTPMGTVQSTRYPESVITHGMCDECRMDFLKKPGVDLKDFLDSLAVPVILIDSTTHVRTANRQAQSLLQKDFPDIQGNSPGDVIECVYAKRPEGCGNTTHCGGCTIRNTVMTTYSSGKGQLNIPATMNCGTSDQYSKVEIRISTEKFGDVVLLRIDESRDPEECLAHERHP